jgi:hypothetical protein
MNDILKDFLFVVYSALEAWSIFAVSFTLFRFNVLKYYAQIVPISILMALLSYAIRLETEWTSWVPVMALVLFTLFIFYTLRISLIGSVIVTITGYSLFILVQTAMMNVLQLAGLRTSDFDMHVLWPVSSFVVLLLSYLLYRFGYGFSFSLDHFRVKRENLIIMVVALVMFLLLTFLHLLKNKLYLVEMIAAAIIFFLIHLALRRERTQW